MYIIYKEGIFALSQEREGAVVHLEPPVYVEDGIEHVLSLREKSDGGFLFEADGMEAEVQVIKQKDSLFYIRNVWKNNSHSVRKIQTIFRTETCFPVEKYLIPCVNVNGNEFGNGKEPKGLARDGKKWIFGYDRVSIPACTLTENQDFAVALFASAEEEQSLVSSCSISCKEDSGRFVQELYHPLVEAPVTYSYRDDYSEGYESFLELEPGACFRCGIYLSVSRPRWENYGICQVLDHGLDLFGDNHDLQIPEEKEIWDRSIAFAKSLITDYKGKKGFIIGFCKDEQGDFVYRDDQCFELAWCGQNVLFSRMLVEDFIRYGHRDSLDDALEILDTRVTYCVAENGLLAAQLKDYEALKEHTADTCNMGYGAYEFLRCYKRLKAIGIDKPAYLKAARGLCDFFCDHYSETHGFGKEWRLDGTCVDPDGAIGAFVIPAMAELYKQTGEDKYLEMAEKSLKFYVERDIDQFCCTAGALDTSCVDKETATPFLISSILLYEITGKGIYLEYGEKAAYYFTSWMYHYEPVYEADSDLARYHMQLKGMTAVSTQHHHLDPYGLLVVPYLRKLAEYTGVECHKIRAEMMFRAPLQCIGDGELTIHGKLRPVGSQNEAFYHCRWAASRRQGEDVDKLRGSMNDWLVAWPCAFRLSVLAEMNF